MGPIPFWIPYAAIGALSLVCWGVYERGEVRTERARHELTDYKAHQAEAATAQMLGIAKESAERSREHLENVRGIVASAETGQKEIRNAVVAKGCDRDALSDATAAAAERLWRERNPRPPAAPAGGRDPARKMP